MRENRAFKSVFCRLTGLFERKELRARKKHAMRGPLGTDRPSERVSEIELDDERASSVSENRRVLPGIFER